MLHPLPELVLVCNRGFLIRRRVDAEMTPHFPETATHREKGTATTTGGGGSHRGVSQDKVIPVYRWRDGA